MVEKQLKVSARYLTKTFDMGKNKAEKVRAVLNPFHKNNLQEFWALKGASFDVYEGDVVGIVGVNGSGKSTLLNILSGLLLPTTGSLTVNGETSIIAINAGLRDRLTGRENIRLKSLMMGKSNKEIKADMDKIIEFSDLGDFIDQPVKSYSSGMKSKLGFAIAVHQDPDILIIDEALSVGDQTFYQKALNKMYEFKENGKTIFFVSHSLGQVESFTDKVMWIQYGELQKYGPTKEVLKEYKQWVDGFQKQSADQKKKYQINQKQKQLSFSLNELTERIRSDENLSRVEKRNVISNTTVVDNLSLSTILLIMSTMGILGSLIWNVVMGA